MNKKLKQVINEALPKAKKVYCKNCRYSGYKKCNYYENRRNPFNDSMTKNTATIGQLYKGDNVNGECPHYQRKWYKFWVK